jgi:hypothetical protein
VVHGLGNPDVGTDLLLQDSISLAGFARLLVGFAAIAEEDALVGHALLDADRSLEEVNGHLNADVGRFKFNVSVRAV